ncbi:class I SAM-dependent methyltransferase [Tolypothrix sp. PCC 7910]|uniref:class I SAM-dependent methyltransferase n=1 Tax=Tolypothrix sp. PCC 7910 TaxID=2099387 RepID=UPI001427879B|nr:class I SAM-dependent methyltransferase [Tolypothrix sp. PCC 7910]QIR40000.1 class I SAM-dependent methyltransferase [Tolypothrix sp. PCC 7910]
MNLQRIVLLLIASVSVASLGVAGCSSVRDFEADAQTSTPTTTPVQQVQPDVPYVPTPQPVVDAMLKLAKVNSNDFIYDLGSGDGRIPITAAQKYGARGVGIDIDPQRVQEAKQNLQSAKVGDRVEFRQQDLFQTDLSKASVVTLYLLPDINLKLRPKLLQELKPGTRIVSHAFDMGDWKPQQVQEVDGKTIYLWVVPENVPANLR